MTFFAFALLKSMGHEKMHKFGFVRYKLTFIVVALLCAPAAFATCSDGCSALLQSCEQSAAEQQRSICQERFEICKLKCNRAKTQGCVWLAFKNYDGVANRERELTEITNGFARITHEAHPHFAGLCSSNSLRCDYVLDWDQTMYSCGGQRREATRVACCR